MGLEEELQNSREEILTLHEHIDALEKLVSDYEALAEDVSDLEGRGQRVYLAWEMRRMQLQQRAKVLLNEGLYDPAKQG